MSNFPLLIPISRLAADPNHRHAQLRDYFCDKDASANLVGDRWALRLKWSNDPGRYVDPRLNEGLAWWGAGIQYQDMAMARKRRGRLLLSLNDTWTLESWSEWLSQRSRHTDLDVLVLHVDDHKDIASPRLFQHAMGWFDPITREIIDLLRPDTVERAIASGAIGMGSFITPFLHYAPNTDIRHLCQAPKCVGTIDLLFYPDSIADTLLAPLELRPTIRVVEDGRGAGPGRYRFTDDVNAWLEGVNESSKDILLHIDMDYFCNRYDGDSDAIESPGPLNLPIEEIITRIDVLTGALKSHDLIGRLADISIAFSPGFFPAEFWAASCDRLLAGLGELPWHNH